MIRLEPVVSCQQSDHFDTVHTYQEGNNEKMCAEFFKDKPRDSFVISTKVIPPGMLDFVTGEIGEDFTVEAYLSMFETSLKRLQMDYVEIFYQHVLAQEEAAAGLGFIGMKVMAGRYLDEDKGKPVNPVAALKWALQNPNICTCIPGFTTYEHIETDVEVMYDISLTPEEEAEIEDGRKLIGLYCQGCNTWLGQCRNGLLTNTHNDSLR